MVDIPIERKSSFPWWALVLALVVAALLWWLLADDTEDATLTPAVTATETVERTDTVVTGPVTDLTMLAGDLNQYVGRQVMLTNVMVGNVAGDRLFYVGDQRVPVVLDQVMTPGQPGIEGRYDVTEGNRVSLQGEVVNVASIPQPVEGLDPAVTAVIQATSMSNLEASNMANEGAMASETDMTGTTR